MNLEVLSGILLFCGMTLALIISNTPLYEQYRLLIKLPVGLTIGDFTLSKSLLKWVNDGLMAMFFLLLTLESKYHYIAGQFSSGKALRLPLISAIGGAVIPVIFYLFFTQHNADYIRGWAIPIATDTAFILAILAIFTSGIPLSARLFVVAFSIIDDIIAVLVLAIFYTPFINFLPLLFAVICVLLLAILNRSRVGVLTPYMIVGFALWLSLIETGIHGTLAGVVIGCFIPVRVKKSDLNRSHSPLKRLERYVHPFVALFVLPLFAFLNSEVSFQELSAQDFLSPITVGIFFGLFLGKQIGITLFAYLGERFNLCSIPKDINWGMFYGLAILAGIGFTFSLFIGVLSFETSTHINQMKLGVLGASFVSAILGILVVRWSVKTKRKIAIKLRSKS